MEDKPTMKSTCTKCKVAKLLEEFETHNGYSNGKGHHCKACRAQYKHDWYVKNRGRRLEVSGAWHKKNPEKHREINRRWRDKVRNG